jgi:hypothetical protein
MGEVVKLAVPKLLPQVVTCGCDGQKFGLVVDEHGQPEFVYCYSCQFKLAMVGWHWITTP